MHSTLRGDWSSYVPGSAGVFVPPQGYLQRLREICDQTTFLLIFDESLRNLVVWARENGSEALGVTTRTRLVMDKAGYEWVVILWRGGVQNRNLRHLYGHWRQDYMQKFLMATHIPRIPIACAEGLAAIGKLIKTRIDRASKTT